jgi:hypothetical protein
LGVEKILPRTDCHAQELFDQEEGSSARINARKKNIINKSFPEGDNFNHKIKVPSQLTLVRLDKTPQQWMSNKRGRDERLSDLAPAHVLNPRD